MNNKFIESMFSADDVRMIDQIGPRRWLVTTRRSTGMRSVDRHMVVEIATTAVNVTRSGRVWCEPVSHDLV